jgi:hypothetical protein
VEFEKISIELWVLEDIVKAFDRMEPQTYQDPYDERRQVKSDGYDELETAINKIRDILDEVENAKEQ